MKTSTSIWLCLGMISSIFLWSCRDSEETAPPSFSNGTPMDALVGDLATAVNLAVRESPQFRELLRTEVVKQFDGDYDLLLFQAVSLELETSGGTRSGDAYTVKDNTQPMRRTAIRQAFNCKRQVLKLQAGFILLRNFKRGEYVFTTTFRGRNFTRVLFQHLF